MLNLEETLKSELPQARYLVLELAGLLDRLDEAARREKRSLAGEGRLKCLLAALDALKSPGGEPNRAEQILRAYSEPLTPDSGR